MRTPSNILLLCWRDTRHPQGGGIETYLERVGAELARRGANVTFLYYFVVTAADKPLDGTVEPQSIFTAVRECLPSLQQYILSEFVNHLFSCLDAFRRMCIRDDLCRLRHRVNVLNIRCGGVIAVRRVSIGGVASFPRAPPPVAGTLGPVAEKRAPSAQCRSAAS